MGTMEIALIVISVVLLVLSISILYRIWKKAEAKQVERNPEKKIEIF